MPALVSSLWLQRNVSANMSTVPDDLAFVEWNVMGRIALAGATFSAYMQHAWAAPQKARPMRLLACSRVCSF
ncbi:hypothetical protein PCAR4_60054 [Paraburkholderia caribensis]|nr:hypothetical protein PCAR4_60054 [Paraburkholderia caribensis]